jgi:TPR repeat protein
MRLIQTPAMFVSALVLVAASASAQPAPVEAVPKAVADCDRLAASPDDPQRAAPPVYSAKLDAAAAIRACDDAVKSQPDNPRLLFQLGRALDWNRQFALARAYYGAASDRNYAPAQAALGLLVQYGDGGFADPAGALGLYRRAAGNGSAFAMTMIGHLYASGSGVTQDAKEALSWYRRAADTGDPVGLNALAFWFAENNRELDEAEALAKKAAAAAPQDPSFVDTLGYVQLRRGRHADAAAQFEKAIGMQPNFAPYHDRLGDAYAAGGAGDKAASAWRKALSLPSPIAGDDPLFSREATEAKLAQ